MTGCDEFRPQLSGFVDGELPAEARAAVERHLAGCAACTGIVRDFERVRTTARQLGPIQPPDHVWLEIAGQMRLGSPSPPPASARPVSGGRAGWQWLGLAAALVLITLGVYAIQRWRTAVPAAARVATAGPAAAGASPGNAGAAGSVETFEDELRQAEQHYDNAIAQLEAIMKNNSGEMDPAVAAVVEKNLTTIDRAIADSRAAVAEHPESAPARDSLFEALRRKVGVLQDTVALINEMRKGDQEGAARVAAGIGRKS